MEAKSTFKMPCGMPFKIWLAGNVSARLGFSGSSSLKPNNRQGWHAYSGLENFEQSLLTLASHALTHSHPLSTCSLHHPPLLTQPSSSNAQSSSVYFILSFPLGALGTPQPSSIKYRQAKLPHVILGIGLGILLAWSR